MQNLKLIVFSTFDRSIPFDTLRANGGGKFLQVSGVLNYFNFLIRLAILVGLALSVPTS